MMNILENSRFIYCNEEHKNCYRCIDEEKKLKRNKELFTRLLNPDGTVDLFMNQEILDEVLESFCNKDIENYD